MVHGPWVDSSHLCYSFRFKDWKVLGVRLWLPFFHVKSSSTLGDTTNVRTVTWSDEPRLRVKTVNNQHTETRSQNWRDKGKEVDILSLLSSSMSIPTTLLSYSIMCMFHGVGHGPYFICDNIPGGWRGWKRDQDGPLHLVNVVRGSVYIQKRTSELGFTPGTCKGPWLFPQT